MEANLSVCHVNATDIRGGAARAAYRIHRALHKHSSLTGVNSVFRCVHKYSNDPSVVGGYPVYSNRLTHKISSCVNRLNRFDFQSADLSSVFSTAFPDSGLANELNSLYAQGILDIAHLHWLGDHTISIEEISRLHMPTVWTFHDMWPFSGAEHYLATQTALSSDSSSFRYKTHYTKELRPSSESGYDLCRATWRRKFRSWTQPIHIVAPSRWMASSSLESSLMHSWPTTVIPYAIDLDQWKPLPKKHAKELLGLPSGAQALLFGADSGLSDPRKGGELLFRSLQILSSSLGSELAESIHLLIFGDNKSSRNFQSLAFPVHFLGHLSDDFSLRIAYSASDLFLLPSIQDNLPNTGIESHACGTPVIAFNAGGMPDIVSQYETGVLVTPFSEQAFASTIESLLSNPQRLSAMSEASRERACSSWSEQIVANQ